MTNQHPATTYSKTIIRMHWLTLVLMIAVYALIEFRGIFPKGSDGRETMKQWHFMLGLLIFTITWLRLAARGIGVTPPIQPTPPRYLAALASAMHITLYGFLLAMPLLGWLTLSAKGREIPFFGLHLPQLIGADKALAQQLEGLHETIGTIGYALIGLHAVAALVHHYLLRDDTLRRMLAGRGGTGTQGA